MRRQAQLFLTILLLAAIQADRPLTAEESAASDNGYHAENFQLGDDELREITSQVMAQHPLLASSPGIKYAGAARHRRSQDVAEVLYYPHIEHAGIKQAFHVGCSRRVPETYWNCDDVRIRRYMALDSQDFEVRISGPIHSDEAMAMIEATRRALPARLDDGSVTPRTAVQILPSTRSGYLVTWGNEIGHQKLMMWARLADGADPGKPEGWLAEVYSPDN